MKRFAFMAFMFLAALLIVPFASAQLPDPTVTFIPDEISANSSFLMVVDPNVEGSIRASWIVYEGPGTPYGQVPKIGDKHVCYFSSTDSKSTCGPSPFALPDFSPYTLEINTSDSDGNVGGESISKEVGNRELRPLITTNFENRMVYINLWVSPGDSLTGVTYETYYAENITTVSGKSGILTYHDQSGAYRKNITLGTGEYYIAFVASTSVGEYGGGVQRVEMASGTGDNGNGEDYLDIDPVSLNILTEIGKKYEKSNFKITNLRDMELSPLSVSIPETSPVDINDYLTIRLSSANLSAFGSMYYSVVLDNLDGSMNIQTEASITSNGTTLGYIPIDISVSIKGNESPDITSCEDKDDMDYCYGGICCNEICRTESNCCDDSDCASDEECTSYNCVPEGTPPNPDIPCTSGTCRTGLDTCPSGQTRTGTCRQSGVDGICCEAQVTDECEGEVDGTYCNSFNGVCCGEECIDGDCCTDADCINAGDQCLYNETWDAWYCTPSGGFEFDITIPIIIVVVILVAVLAWYLLKKRKGGKGLEEEFEEGTEEFDEEFY